ncbi:MAG: aspartyl protease family protein [Candidatus Krumholzibacteriota bacterium]|nr:aspartyl protease family protein [Candidatus Krumholzibacteriota bacterium]
MITRLQLIIFLLFIPMTAHSSALRHNDTAKKILRKHIKALGGADAVRSVKSSISTSDVSIIPTGMKGTIKQWSVKPCLYRSELSLGLFTITQGFDGETPWMIDQNDKVTYNRDKSSMKKQITSCFIDQHRYLFAEENIEFSGSDTSSGGSPCHVLTLEPDGGYPCRIYIDKKTHLTDEIIIEAVNGYFVERYDDYRQAGKMMFPFKTSIHSPVMNQTIETTITSININPAVNPSIFIPPSGTTNDYGFLEGHSSENIPFSYIGRHIYLPVRLGAKKEEHIFLLDSGAGITVIDSTLAADSGFPIGDRITGAGIGGSTFCYMTRVPGFKIKGISFNAQTLIALPLGNITTRFSNVETGGILGYDFLSRFVTQINYEDQTISFFEPDSYKHSGKGQIIDAPLSRKVFSVEGVLDGEFKGNFVIDTGANRSLLLRGFAERNDLFSGRKLVSVSAVGAGGEKKADLSRFKSLEISGIKLLSPLLFIAGGKSGFAAFGEISGIIGNDILERFKLTLDYSSQQIIIEKNADFSKPFPSDKSGLQTAWDSSGSLYIHNVIPDSPASAKGIKKGDRLISINGKKISLFGDRSEITRLFRQKEGTRLKLLIGREKKRITVTIRLREYF